MTVTMAEPVDARVGGAAGEDSPSARPRRPLALSPSRAGDFKSCPLLYRLRAVDRLHEPPSPDAVRGTLVHSVLEEMFGRPAADRTPARTMELVEPAWQRMAEESPELAGMLPEGDVTRWLDSARSLVRSYFNLEDPRRFDPQACEYAVEIDANGVPLRGFIDRLDLAPTGELRIVDYKTGRSPSPDFEGRALYQLKFYALMIYRLRGVVPAQLKLIYLADGLSLQYSPTESELRGFANAVGALWRAVAAALETGNFPARRGPMCRWCAHQALCPEYGGTPPPYPGPPLTTAPNEPAPPSPGSSQRGPAVSEGGLASSAD
jgi:putative RecB family exonuclease